MGDQSWRHRPKIVSPETVELFARRVQEHIEAYGLSAFEVFLHGGEPLLVGKARMIEILTRLRQVETETRADILLTVQTNGVLFDEEWASVFVGHGCRVGISHDGPPSVSDKARVYVGGRPAGTDTEAAVRLACRTMPGLFDGCLAVLDPLSDPVQVVDYFYHLGTPKLDLLLPDQNYVNHSGAQVSALAEADKYSSYLLAAYERWRAIDDPAFDIRFFRQLMLVALGHRSSLDSIGVGDVGLFTVDTDGAIEVTDTYRICGDHFTASSRTLEQSSFHEFRLDHGVVHLLGDDEPASGQCLSCRHHAMCGGGYRPHRFNGVDFAAPSVYCDTLYALCDRIQTDISAELERARFVASGMESGRP